MSAECSRLGILQPPLLTNSDVPLFVSPTCLQSQGGNWFDPIEAHFVKMFESFRSAFQHGEGQEVLIATVSKFFVAPELPLGLGMCKTTSSQGRGVGNAQAMKAARHVIPCRRTPYPVPWLSGLCLSTITVTVPVGTPRYWVRLKRRRDPHLT